MADTRTKRIVQDAAFTQKAAGDPVGALAFMVMAAFGVSLNQLTDAVDLMMKHKHDDVVVLCVDAGIQVRGNVTFVTANFGGGKLRTNYPVFLINSQRETGDDFNFSALHAAGHVICALSNGKLASKILAKAGNCITGSTFPQSVAGKINAEIKASWTDPELTAFNTWVNSVSAADKTWLNTTVESIADKATTYAGKSPSATTAPTGSPAAAAATKV